MITIELVYYVLAIFVVVLIGGYTIFRVLKAEKETRMLKSKQKTIPKLEKSEDGDFFKKQIPQASSTSIPPSSSPQPTTIIKEREVITREVVLIPCSYCGGLMPQASTNCPHCGAKRKI